MSNLAIYRKYRPQTFDDILGQDVITQILKETAKRDNFSHAYLFSGPRGTGKTTTARLIAKTANCEKRQEDDKFRNKGEPCNECESCLKTAEGRNLDMVEIDAASNRGIDDIRNLRDNIKTAPSASTYKVFIIDEAHMLTKEAFNALLKTLEEPPEYVILIMATTELEKIPATITSRAQKFHFKKVPLKRIAQKINSIAETEDINIDEEAVELIASAAEGSFRDAESLLDQLVSTKSKSITVEDVEGMIGKIGFDKLSEVAGVLLENNLDKALKTINEIDEEGHSLTSFTKDLLRYLRRTAVLKFSPDIKEALQKELTEDHLEQLQAHTELFQKKDVGLIKKLVKAYSQMRYSEFPIIPLETAIIEHLKD